MTNLITHPKNAPDALEFMFEDQDVRVVLDEDGEPWFLAVDVCSLLEVTNTTQALARLDDDERAMFNIGRQGSANTVNESGLFSLILGSRKPEAKKIKKWVTSEVLPSIRKTGSYSLQPKPMSQIEVLLASVQMLADVEKRQLELEQQQQQVQQNLAQQKTKLLQIDNKITTGLEEVKETNLLTSCPSAAESITSIRLRMNEEYGLSASVVDAVMRQSLYAPKPVGMVRNQHESSGGSTYAVYWKKDVSTVFKMFVGECKQAKGSVRFTHPFVTQNFKLIK